MMMLCAPKKKLQPPFKNEGNSICSGRALLVYLYVVVASSFCGGPNYYYLLLTIPPSHLIPSKVYAVARS